ncbi:ADP-ribosylglycohydrolase family protein [Flavobacterium sp. NRK F10]|uniref:ADP-ribosylglycohydrolase family protein n=1 Tax=Flavobacterium sp. NRK F10 TaxID=2954931 RepID=UPI0020903472|nr:ADP-ribosylglycohydrolase family protein [Flavobacterium sp. NRK F10]MCO6174653.1 ADP-ribosylglycohydrolase family protein [Flavobacterium sp. NRK F10]
MEKDKLYGALFGLAIGDALGVPVEFKSREFLKKYPVQDMQENGSHGQPKGTWSDDSSLAFCLAESLCEGFDIDKIALLFLQWYNEEIWTPHGTVFDIGIATRKAIHRISQGESPVLCGGFNIGDNGNGSLMRILPLVFCLKKEKDYHVVYQRVKDVSSITHAHFRSVFSCFIYIVYALEIMKGLNKKEAYHKMKEVVSDFISDKSFNKMELQLFDRVLRTDISNLKENEIRSGGYVLDSLEAGLWCVLNSDNYEETVLKAVNLGEDTDTTGAIAGGLAGLIYGYKIIPEKWISQLVRKDDITKLCDRLSEKYEIPS